MLGDIAQTIANIRRCPSGVTSPPAWVSPHHHISSCPPLVNSIMVNTNESFFSGHTHWGIGEIFYDDQGNPVFHFGKRLMQNRLSKQKSLQLGRASLLLSFLDGPTLLVSFLS